jgi:hypothetical protein
MAEALTHPLHEFESFLIHQCNGDHAPGPDLGRNQYAREGEKDQEQ